MTSFRMIAVMASVAAFPDTVVQTCIVHLQRHSLNFASWKDRKAVAAALKDIPLLCFPRPGPAFVVYNKRHQGIEPQTAQGRLHWK